jgi:NAD(P)H-quinone oxidoreductase subunit 5
MALPMVSLTVIVLVLPLVFQRLNPVPGLAAVDLTSSLLVMISGALGVLTGSLVRLDRFWSRSVIKPLRAVQDLLAYDFYTDKLYRATIVKLVASFADLTNRFDQEVITGLANRLGLLSMQGAQGLKLVVGGQMQTYVLTAVLAIVLLLGSLIWSLG